MKDKAWIYLSLVVSFVALGYTTWVHQQAEQMADEALQRRERQFVVKFAPKVREVYKGLGATNKMVSNPTNLDELFGPYIDLMNRIGESQTEETNKTN